MEELAANVTIEELSPVKKKLSFDIPWTDVKRELDSAYNLVGRTVKIKGFRPGKVPRRVLEMHYRKDAEGEAVTNLISKNYDEAIRKNDIAAVAQPQIDQQDIELEKNFCFTATVEVRPEVELQDYTGLAVTKEEVEVTDGDVDARIDQLREMYATLEAVAEDRPAAEGDFLVIDFEVTVDDAIRDELTTKNYTIQIGGGKFLPGFEEQLKGLKKGEEKTVGITFPDDYQPAELAGKEGFFRVTVKDVMEKKVPALDEEFIKNFDAFERLVDLRDAVRKSIVDEAAVKSEGALKKKIVDALLAKHDFAVPSIWVEHQTYQLMLDTQRRMTASGMGSEKAAEISWNMQGEFRPHAERMVKSSLLLGRIAEKESITVEESELEARIAQIAAMHGQSLDKVHKMFDENNGKDRLRDELLEEKALAFLVDRAELTVEKIPFTDSEKETP